MSLRSLDVSVVCIVTIEYEADFVSPGTGQRYAVDLSQQCL